jgi:hypothetical protein
MEGEVLTNVLQLEKPSEYTEVRFLALGTALYPLTPLHSEQIPSAFPGTRNIVIKQPIGVV